MSYFGAIFCILGGAVALVGAMNIAYQIYRMTELDARSRGLKHPKLWGLISTGSQNGSGILLYLIGRRNYVSTISLEGRAEIESRKKKIGVALIFLTLGVIVMTAGFLMQ